MSRSTTNWIFVTPLVIAVLWLTKPTLTGGEAVDRWVDLIGFIAIITGLIIRIVARDWKACRSHAGLVTTGPYSLIRHPMYVASYLAGIGLCIIMGNLIFGVAFTIIYIAVHLTVAKKEEKFLLVKWPEEYKSYKTSVPAVIPSPQKLIRKLLTRKPWVSNTRSAILREIGTICGILGGAIMLDIRETYGVLGWTRGRGELTGLFIAVGFILIVWLYYSIKRPNTDPIPL